MLLFISMEGERSCIAHKFQYISCYSLSVTLPDNYGTFWKFQYISCYSLSMYESYSDHFKKEFQYISCYSLSINAKFISSHKPVSIHLMLLFIPARINPAWSGLCFNTSHVTLYQKEHSFLSLEQAFQYISCYSLSQSRCVVSAHL